MSAPSTIPATAWIVPSNSFSLAFASQDVVDETHQREIERLRNGGEHSNPNEDFTFYVILPLLVLVGLMIVGRRIIS